MTYDQAQGARLGQRTPPENPGVRLCTVSELPEVAYTGQIIYLTDLDVFNVYDGVAWQNPGGTNTYVQADPPDAPNVGDLWVRTSDRTVFVWNGTEWTIVSEDDTGAIINPANLGSGKLTGALDVDGSVGSSATGKRVELNDTGLVQYATDGTTTETYISGVDGSVNVFTGTANLDSLSSGDTSFQGQVRLEQGATLSLAGAVNSPLTVSLSTGYTGQAFNAVSYFGDVISASVNSALDHAWAVTNQEVSGSYTRGYVYEDDKYYVWPSTSTLSGTFSSFLPVSSCRITTDVGDRTFILGEAAFSSDFPSQQLAMRVYDTSAMTNTGSVAPTLKASSDYGDVTATSRSYAVGRCFTNGGTSRRNQVVIGRYTNTSGTITLSRFIVAEASPSITLTGTARNITLPTSGGSLLGVAYGSSLKMGFQGSNQDVFVISTTNGNYVYTDVASPVRLTDLEFPRISVGSQAFLSAGDVSTNSFTNFWALPVSGAGLFGYQYTNASWNGSETWWVGISWRDQTGAQETKPSSLFSVTPKKRSSLTVTSPTLPPPASGSRVATDAYGFVVYVGKGSTAPANGSMWKQSVQPADLSTTQKYTAYPDFSGTSNPLTVSTFTTGTAAKIAYPASNVANFNGNDTGDTTCDANGDIFINHGLGVTPSHASITPRGAYLPRIVGKTSTQIRVRFHSITTGTAGNPLANGTTVRVEWQAWRMV